MPNEHEYLFQTIINGEKIGFKLYEPWSGSFERLEAAKGIIQQDDTDAAKLQALLKLFCPQIYKFEVGRITSNFEPL